MSRTLSRKAPDLIRNALRSLEWVHASEQFVFTAKPYCFEPTKRVTLQGVRKVCLVNIVGAVMAHTLESQPTRRRSSIQFDVTTGYRLKALEAFSEGEINLGLYWMEFGRGKNPKSLRIVRKKYRRARIRMKVAKPSVDLSKFKSDLLRVAKHLERRTK